VDCNYAKNEQGLPCDPYVAPCLFDLMEDPCEINNLATLKQDILEEMLSFVAQANQSYVHSLRIKSIDPRSDPALNGGLWGPWQDKDE
jgi:hypothetical protein